ncbi:protein kinase domain-containing protein [Ornithinicoccus halotolerans]|uniref:protein kinase domain-containing protein n=1 Tax=Ornithinicoccus halotolerans TaxID=1748220 RepID=UPI001885D5AC|nr:protein kinase [Ornithinicoccus halotolerans]
MQEFDAVVFDFDGVLADTDAGWARTEAAMRERYGLPYTAAVAEQTHGVGMLDSVRLLTADAPHPVDEDEALAAMRALAAEAVPAAARPFPGARAAVARIGEQLPVAIASNSERPMLELLVNRLGLDDLVDAVVSASDVAAVLDADVDGEAPYIVTEYVPGRPLDEIIAREGPLEGEALVRLGRGLSEALGAIHGAGVVHRDLKPGNVLMVGADPVVIDFGIAQVADDARLTMTGMVMGTPGYLSPEVVEGGEVTEATDWWGWAATLAFANSGDPPFGRAPASVVLDRVTRGRTRLDGVDPQLRPLLAAALDPDPGYRPHAQEVMDALQLYAQHRPVTGALTRQLGRRGPGAGPVPEASGRQHTPPEPWAGDARAMDLTSAMPPVDPTRVQQLPPASGHVRREPAADRAARVLPPPADPWSPGPGPQPPEPLRPGAEDDYGRDPRIGRPPRSGTVAAMTVGLVGLASFVPLLAWAALAVWSVAARTTDHALTSLVLRRHDAGPRRSDVPVLVLSSPWHLLQALLGTALALLLPLALGAAVTVVTALGLTEFAGWPVGYEHPVPVATGMLVGGVFAWWGPGGLSLRRGSRTLLRGMLPGHHTTTLVVGFLLAAGAALLAWTMLEGGSQGTVSWWPLPPGARPLESWIPPGLLP